MKYQIQGEPMPVVICELQNGETLVCESGAMSWMSANMKMETKGGGAGKMLGRMFSGETMFQNRYTAEGGPGMIAFASSFPGSIRAVEISPSNPIVIQKKAATGFFGGEGFIMQKLSGNGIAFLEIDGSVVEYNLGPGQQIVAETGYVAMMDATCKMDIQSVKGVKNVLFGGEGLFHTIVTGPGRVTLQTMPMNAFAAAVARYVPKSD